MTGRTDVKAICFSALVLFLAQPASAQWQTGRATFYGTDEWSIHEGSCGYGYLDQNVGTGWDVAALSDQAGDFQGSCGRCKEVRCKHMTFADGYGQWLERTNVCYNTYSSVVVTVTDACDCNYTPNMHSNKRWCCGDMYHIDLSVWAYEKLSSKKWGVLAVEWRDVPCWYKPRNPASVPTWTKRTPTPEWYVTPAGWARDNDRRRMGRTLWPNKQNGNGRKLLDGQGASTATALPFPTHGRASRETMCRQRGLSGEHC